MGVRINTNVEALNAQRNLALTATSFAKSVEKLSSGLRINRAADDAAGLTISEKLRGQARGLNQAVRNAQDGISLIQTAEGALGETHSILQRMRELAVQSASDTLTDSDRSAIQKEVASLKSEITRISDTTEFNTKKLINGEISTATTAQGTILDSAELYSGAGAYAAGTTSLVDLGSAVTATTGNAFGLVSGDVINIDGIVNGSAQTTVTLAVTGANTVANLLTSIDSLTGGTSAVNASGQIVITGASGTANELTEIQLSVTNRTLFNNKLGAWEETQAAQDTAVDASLTLQIGANSGQTLAVGVSNMSVSALSLGSVDVSSQQGAKTAITVIDSAISKVSSQRSDLGATQNRLEHTIANLGVASENMTASESRIRDVDLASEMVNFTRSQILQQAGTAILAQANQAPNSVLQLLR